jgi:hypothetical protein
MRSMKYLGGYKLFFELIFIIDLAHDLVTTVLCFRCDPYLSFECR